MMTFVTESGKIINNPNAYCRLCLSYEHKIKSIFDEFDGDEDLQHKLWNLLEIEVTPSDSMSSMICEHCLTKIYNWQSYKNDWCMNQYKLELGMGMPWRNFQFKMNEKNVNNKPAPQSANFIKLETDKSLNSMSEEIVSQVSQIQQNTHKRKLQSMRLCDMATYCLYNTRMHPDGKIFLNTYSKTCKYCDKICTCICNHHKNVVFFSKYNLKTHMKSDEINPPIKTEKNHIKEEMPKLKRELEEVPIKLEHEDGMDETKFKKLKRSALDALSQTPKFKCTTCLAELSDDTTLQIHRLEKHNNVDVIMLKKRFTIPN